MSRCTCVPCKVCDNGKCDCRCKNGPYLDSIDTYGLRLRIQDMDKRDRDKLKKELFGEV